MIFLSKFCNKILTKLNIILFVQYKNKTCATIGYQPFLPSSQSRIFINNIPKNAPRKNPSISLIKSFVTNKLKYSAAISPKARVPIIIKMILSILNLCKYAYKMIAALIYEPIHLAQMPMGWCSIDVSAHISVQQSYMSRYILHKCLWGDAV